MSYWCDDAGLRLEQNRLDAQQAKAAQRIRDKVATALAKDKIAEMRSRHQHKGTDNGGV